MGAGDVEPLDIVDGLPEVDAVGVAAAPMVPLTLVMVETPVTTATEVLIGPRVGELAWKTMPFEVDASEAGPSCLLSRYDSR